MKNIIGKKMNDVDDVQTFVRNIINNEKPEQMTNPRKFCEEIISLLQSQDQLQSNNNSSFHNCIARQNTAVLRLSSLTAVGIILESNANCNKSYSNLFNSDSIDQQMLHQSPCKNEVKASSLKESSLHFKEKEHPQLGESSQYRDDSRVWKLDESGKEKYFQYIRNHLISNGITLLLVQSLLSKCKFTSHLARKALLNGVHTKCIKVDDVILALAKKINDEGETALSVIFGFLRLLFSDGDLRVTDWEHLTSILQCGSDKFFLASRHPLVIENSTYLMEYTWFLQVFCKLAWKHSSESVKKLVYSIITTGLNVVSENSFLTNIPFSHLVCTKFLKATNAIFDSNPTDLKVTSDSVISVAHTYLTVFPSFVTSIKDSPILKTSNFVGSKMKTDNSPDEVMRGQCDQPVSCLLRLLVFVGLKSCVSLCSVSAVSQDEELVKKFLQHDVCRILNLPAGSAVSDWLAQIFADHDQMWISSLFSLLTIYNQISRCERRQDSPSQEGRTECQRDCLPSCQPHTDESIHTILNATSPSSPCSDFVASLNPFTLFLQFLSFTHFDHIVLADFLLSPETLFLPYLMMLLHCVRRNWEHFKEVCQHFSMKNKADSHEELIECKSKYKMKRPLSECSDFRVAKIFHSAPNNVKALSRDCDIRNSSSNLVSYSDSESSNEETSSNDSSRNDGNDQSLSESRDQSSANELLLAKNTESLDCVLGDSSNTENLDCVLGDSNNTENLDCVLGDSSNTESLDCVLGDSNHTETLDCVLGVLIRLRFHLERLNNNKLIPFKIDPLISLITSCEDRYEDVQEIAL